MSTYEFMLLHDTQLLPPNARFADPVYDALKTDPPQGCVPEDFRPYFGLKCVREAESKWQAVTGLIAEIRSRYGMTFNDLGYERLYEWYGGDPDGSGPEMVVQLLSMAAVRGREVGLDVEELVAFLRTIWPPQDVGRSSPRPDSNRGPAV